MVLGGTVRPRFIVTETIPDKPPRMNNKPERPTRKFGANRNEPARKARKHDANFAQSRDIREDRGERQMKAARERQTLPHLKLPG